MDYLLQQASVHGLGEGGVGDDGGLLLDDPDVLRGDGGRQGDQEEDQHLDVRSGLRGLTEETGQVAVSPTIYTRRCYEAIFTQIVRLWVYK